MTRNLGVWTAPDCALVLIPDGHGEPAGRLAAPGQASSASSSRDPRGFLRNGLFAGLSGLFLTTTDFVAVRVPEVAL
jgi:hypothetical protein